MRLTVPFVAVGLALAATLPAASGSVSQRTTYFAVRGSTLEELDRSLASAGPLVAATGARHPGATEVRFDGRVHYKESGSRCAVAGTELSLDLNIVLPRWTPPRRADAETRLIWQTLEEDIARHEAEHAAIARLWLKKMESAIRNLRPARDCVEMERQVDRVSARYLGEHERAQVEFDKQEGRSIGRRLARALQRNIAAAEAEAAQGVTAAR